MPLDAIGVQNQLDTHREALDKLTTECQDILSTQLHPSDSPWYADLQNEFGQMQDLARAWLGDLSTAWQGQVLSCLMDCTSQFSRLRPAILQLFDEAQADPAPDCPELVANLNSLAAATQAVDGAAQDYENRLRTWGQDVQGAHDRMSATVGQVQARADALDATVRDLNAQIGPLQREISQDMAMIAEARRIENTPGVGLVMALARMIASVLGAMGASTTAEALDIVGGLQARLNTILPRFQAQSAARDKLRAEAAGLQGLLLPGRSALNDLETAAGLLDDVRASWSGFSQELDGVIGDVQKAETANVLVVARAWFDASCEELAAITGNAGSAPASPPVP